MYAPCIIPVFELVVLNENTMILSTILKEVPVSCTMTAFFLFAFANCLGDTKKHPNTFSSHDHCNAVDGGNTSAGIWQSLSVPVQGVAVQLGHGSLT